MAMRDGIVPVCVLVVMIECVLVPALGLTAN